MSHELVPLGELGEIIAGSTPDTNNKEYWGGDISWITPADLTNHEGIYFTGELRKITEVGYKSCSTKMLPAGSILFSSRAPIGHCAITSFPLCTNQGFKSIIPNERLDSVYGYFALKFFTPQIEAFGRGATFAEVNKEIFENFAIPLPPLAEQKRIASLLARVDRLRQLRRTAHDLGDALLQSVFLEMFGEPARNEKGWDRVELAELIRSDDTINYGVVQPGDDFPNGRPVIRVGDLANLSQNIGTLKLIDPKIEANYKRSRIAGDEILIACVGSIGRVALVNEQMKDFNIVRAVARVRADYSLVNRLYLATYLSMPFVQDFFQKETRTVSQPTLNITQIEETPVLVPPLRLQEEFAGVVARVESLRGRMSESTRQVDGLFESLLTESFGG